VTPKQRKKSEIYIQTLLKKPVKQYLNSAYDSDIALNFDESCQINVRRSLQGSFNAMM